MNYYEIGQRVRKFRKAHSLSQEQLAEKVGISTPHMSHIETGNTKLSLPVLVNLAAALEVRTDDLLYDHTTAALSTAVGEVAAVLETCSAQQANVIVDLVKSSKIAMDKHL